MRLCSWSSLACTRTPSSAPWPCSSSGALGPSPGPKLATGPAAQAPTRAGPWPGGAPWPPPLALPAAAASQGGAKGAAAAAVALEGAGDAYNSRDALLAHLAPADAQTKARGPPSDSTAQAQRTSTTTTPRAHAAEAAEKTDRRVALPAHVRTIRKHYQGRAAATKRNARAAPGGGTRRQQQRARNIVQRYALFFQELRVARLAGRAHVVAPGLLLDLRTRHEAETPSSHGLCGLACELRQAHSLASAGHSIYNTPNSFTRILRFVRQSNRQVSFWGGAKLYAANENQLS